MVLKRPLLVALEKMALKWVFFGDTGEDSAPHVHCSGLQGGKGLS